MSDTTQHHHHHHQLKPKAKSSPPPSTLSASLGVAMKPTSSRRMQVAFTLTGVVVSIVYGVRMRCWRETIIRDPDRGLNCGLQEYLVSPMD